MKFIRGSRVGSLFCALVVAVALFGHPASTALAACDAGQVCAEIYGSSSPAFAPAQQAWSGYFWNPGIRFTVPQTSILHEMRWYRCTTGATRPYGFQIFSGTTLLTTWTGANSSYTDVTDNAAVGWQITSLMGSNRITLSPGTTYTVTSMYQNSGNHCVDDAYSPVGSNGVVFVENAYRTSYGLYPNTVTSNAYGVDVGVQYGSAGTATPVPATSTPVPTLVPATATPLPTATPNIWAGYPTQIPYPTQRPYPTPAPMPTPVDYTGPLADIRTAVDGAVWEIGHLPERFFAGAIWALVPDQQALQEIAAITLASFQAQVPFVGQAVEVGAALAGSVVEGDCASMVGVGMATPWGSVNIPPPQFITWWCPWRTVAGVLIMLGAALKMANDLMNVMNPDAS